MCGGIGWSGGVVGWDKSERRTGFDVIEWEERREAVRDGERIQG